MTRTVTHKAGWVMVDPDRWVENGTVEVTDGRVTAVGHARAYDVDHGAGVILPALVNAHAHVSLSALAGKIATDQGFVPWVRELIAARETLTVEQVAKAAASSAMEAKASGTGLIAEVGSLEPGRSALHAAGLEGVIFAEVLGSTGELPSLPEDVDGLSFSYAGHGLHTTDPDLLRGLKAGAAQRHRPFSIHLAESEAETEFLATGDGVWAELLRSRGLDFRLWDLGNERPVPRAKRLGLLGPGTLAVHVLDATGSELQTLARTGTSVCLCPRSNLALHGRLPDIGAFVAAGMAPALGTDSLASAPSLSLFDEMAFVTAHYPDLSPEAILALAGRNGAQALGRTDLGTLDPGMRARCVYAEISAKSARDAAAALVSSGPITLEWL
ncbi:MAG: amidohydrolase family protein [Thermodesulfobacteriota bacterium]